MLGSNRSPFLTCLNTTRARCGRATFGVLTLYRQDGVRRCFLLGCCDRKLCPSTGGPGASVFELRKPPKEWLRLREDFVLISIVRTSRQLFRQEHNFINSRAHFWNTKNNSTKLIQHVILYPWSVEIILSSRVKSFLKTSCKMLSCSVFTERWGKANLWALLQASALH